MGRKRWLLITTAILVLVVSVTGGVVLAHGGGSSDGSLTSFVSRVASILGVDETEVQDAFDQASKEIRDEALQKKLDSLVESGRLTQEQADEYKSWLDARPEGLFPGLLPGLRGHGFHKGFGLHFRFGFRDFREYSPATSGVTGDSA